MPAGPLWGGEAGARGLHGEAGGWWCLGMTQHCTVVVRPGDFDLRAAIIAFSSSSASNLNKD